MSERTGIFAGDNPFELAQAWLRDAEQTEINDPNAMSLATVDETGLPNVRIVLLKDVTPKGFWFYTNYESAKGGELKNNSKAALTLHWKSLRRQLRVRGDVHREDGKAADEYYASRALESRLGAWASKQSQPLSSRDELMKEVAAQREEHGVNPQRPSFWGGFRVEPLEIEFWAEGDFRLHDRFVWRRNTAQEQWHIQRLNP
ncbi:MAG: pyridoxamine 5'-phosphate oxidase [Pseudomonadota bacterium]